MPVQFYYNLYLILFAAWRRRYLLVIPVLVMPLVGGAIGWLTPKEYESRTTFMVPQDAPLCARWGGAGSGPGQ
ncbi:hypothetical protein [Aeromonas sp.]|uniref:hypothetical protein n=1 Tax=Aeromonas sp. TaxID=647 RepID=UPI00258C085F|nr:hypothetical protein [Aeromonas sp.]MCX7128556.1 hypothetical protein [Aeromonas sp.]